MAGTVKTYFSNYVGSQNGFKKFHNEVINMPRAKFTDIGLQILQVLASYLLLIKDQIDQEGNDYKEIMNLIHLEIKKGNYPKFRDQDFENKYFDFEDLNSQYDDPSVIGRMFRHYMGLCAFWGIIKSKSRRKKTIDFDKCLDFISIDPEQIEDFTRNLSLSVDIKHNDFIKNLEEISIKDNANYHPTLMILKYMKSINRPVTDFEISILLGRIDSVQDDRIILQRAIDIGNTFLSVNRNSQMEEFFDQMDWKDEQGNRFRYSPSQQPWFKFHTYILFLEEFSLIEKNQVTGNFTLTKDALELLDEIPATIIDLNRLISKLKLDTPNNSDAFMKDILIKTNMDTLISFVSNQDLLKKINHYSINHPIIAKNGKPQRNQFIAELARIREQYQCQAGSKTFERPDGRNYVEAHHIIEFAKGGPDILENLLALGPTPHVQLHRGSERAKNDMYIHLMTRGAIKYELFKTMIEEYHALKNEHLDFLLEKRLISSAQYDELLSLI